MADALPHPGDTDAGAPRVNPVQLFSRHSLTFILNFQRNGPGTARQPQARGLAAGMAMNVRKALLHDAKHRQFDIAGESAEALIDVEVDDQMATFLQSLYVPANGLRQAIFIQKRRMQKIGCGAYLLAQLLNQVLPVVNRFTERRVLRCVLRHAGEAHAERGYDLSGAVMELTGNMPPFIILDLQQAIRQLPELFRLLKNLLISLLQFPCAIEDLDFEV